MFSFLLSHSTLFIHQTSIFFALFYGYFITYFISSRNQLHLQGKDYALFIFVSSRTHITYGFIHDSGATQCLINWFDFLLYYINNIPAQQSLQSSLYMASTYITYQIENTFLFLPKCILLNFYHSCGSKTTTKMDRIYTQRSQGKKQKEVGVDQLQRRSSYV